MLARPIGHNNPDAEDASHFLSIIASTARTPRLTRTGECEKESNEKEAAKEHFGAISEDFWHHHS